MRLAFFPPLYAFYLGIVGDLGADPVREFEHRLGLWALRLLCLGLAVTPLRDLFKINLIAYRGHWGFWRFIMCWRILTIYLTLDRGLIFSSILGDILKRPYIMLGMLGLILLIPLAVTSNRGLSVSWAANGTPCTRLAISFWAAGLLHFVLSRMSFTLEPAFYTAIVIMLWAID